MTSGTLCEQFVGRAHSHNVSFLTIPGGLAASGAVCSEDPSFTSVYTPAPDNTQKPTDQPTSRPSSAPHSTRKHKLYTSGFNGFLLIVLLIWLLRFVPSFIGVLRKKGKKDTHLYDILVVINDSEEAILKNIRHQDIAFFRRILDKSEKDPKHSRWTMNDTSELLEKRFEVQFFDQYDLLGNNSKLRDDNDGTPCRAVDHTLSGNQLVTTEIYIQEARLQLGMILKVKPSTTYMKKHPEKQASPAKVHIVEPESPVQEKPVIPPRKGSSIFPSDYKNPRVEEGDSVFSPMGHSPDHSEQETEGAFVRGRGFPENPTNLWGYSFGAKSSSPKSNTQSDSSSSARPKRASIIYPDAEEPSPLKTSWKKSNYTSPGSLASKEYDYNK